MMVKDILNQQFSNNDIQYIIADNIGINLSGRDQKVFERFNSAIEHYYKNEETRIDHLAEATFMSVRNLQRKIKQLTYRTPIQYLRYYRLFQSVILLKRGLPIEDVIINVGFVSHNHFIKSFKDMFYITPKQYQMKCRYQLDD